MAYDPTTIIAEIDKGLAKHNKEVLIGTKRNGQWIETGKDEFQKKVRQFALGLYELGVRKDDKVSLHSENSAEWVICDQAILSLGAVNVPIYTTQPGEQIKYILQNSEAKAHIVSDDELYADTNPLMAELDEVETVISLLGSDYKGVKDFDDIL